MIVNQYSLLCTFPQCLSFGLWLRWFGIEWCWRSISCFRLLVSLPYMSIEAGITENNPQYANRIIKQLNALKKLITLMILMTLTGLLMALCHHMLLPTRRYNRCTSMYISVMPINLASLRMALGLRSTLRSVPCISKACSGKASPFLLSANVGYGKMISSDALRQFLPGYTATTKYRL